MHQLPSGMHQACIIMIKKDFDGAMLGTWDTFFEYFSIHFIRTRRIIFFFFLVRTAEGKFGVYWCRSLVF